MSVSGPRTTRPTATASGSTPSYRGHARQAAGLGVTAVVNGLLMLLSLSGVVAERTRRVLLQPTA